MMKRFDLIGSFIWIAIGISQCIGSIQLRLGNFSNPGPGLLPFITGALLGLFGLILMFSSISKESGEEAEFNGQEILAKGKWKSILFVLLVLFGYAFLLKILGFLITTFIFFFLLFGLNEPKKWVMPLIFSGVTSGLSYLFFDTWLKVTFPRGILGF
jgi:putative tricarboxylic transport membrane protein